MATVQILNPPTHRFRKAEIPGQTRLLRVLMLFDVAFHGSIA
jgi:hypothetical protein